MPEHRLGLDFRRFCHHTKPDETTERRRTTPTLGTLGLEVLELVWGVAPTTAQAVLEQLSRRRITLTIMLLHEYAHAYRGDNLRKLLAGVATLPWPRVHRKLVLYALHDAADKCCDAFVAREVGDPGRVANTIMSVSRWSGGSDPGFERAVCGRIDRLLRSHAEDGQVPRICAVVIPLVIVVVVTAAPALHYYSEAILRLL